MHELNWGNNKPAYVIAELGCNHCGNIDIAMEMVIAANNSGADCVKIQKRDMSSLSKYSDDKEYDNPNSFGKTYTSHRKALELSIDEIYELKSLTDSLGIDFSASCWDKKSIDEMENLVDFYKIQSADSHNKDFIDYIISKKKPLIMSVGGTNYEQIADTVGKCESNKVDLAILHCTPIYPLDFKQVHLNNIVKLQSLFPKNIIGYSGHEKGISVSVSAVALGAKIIERHFTLDRTMKGGDQSASLEPQGFSKMVRDIRHIEEALGEYDKVSYEEEETKLASLNLTRKPFNWSVKK